MSLLSISNTIFFGLRFFDCHKKNNLRPLITCDIVIGSISYKALSIIGYVTELQRPQLLTGHIFISMSSPTRTTADIPFSECGDM